MHSDDKAPAVGAWCRFQSSLVTLCFVLASHCGRAHAQPHTPRSGSDPNASAIVVDGSAGQEGPRTTLSSSNAAQVTLGVLLLDPPLELERAVVTALSPWGVRVERVVRVRPGSTLPGTALDAGALARELNADALVWLSSNTDGAALWLYERANDTVVARPVPERPLDKALAAGLALSVKTWLRLSDPSPKAEAPASAPAIASTSTRLAVQLPSGPPQAPDAQPPDDAARMQLAVYAAGRRGALTPDVTEPRYGVELRASAWRSENSDTQLWLGVRFDSGEPTAVTRDTFRGIYSELGAGLSVAISQQLAGWLNLGFYSGITLYHASLSGTLLADGTAAERSRGRFAAQFGPEVELSLGPLGIVAQPGIGASFGSQRYAADRVEVLETSKVWWLIGGGLRVSAF